MNKKPTLPTRSSYSSGEGLSKTRIRTLYGKHGNMGAHKVLGWTFFYYKEYKHGNYQSQVYEGEQSSGFHLLATLIMQCENLIWS